MGQSILELAEAPARFDELTPEEARVERADGVVFFGTGVGERGCSVQRVRFDGEAPDAVVERLRALIRSRGRGVATWELATWAHPPEVIDRLLSLGMRPALPPVAVVMALSSPPPAASADVAITEVDTLEEFKVHVSITHEVFGMLEQLPAELARIDKDGSRKLSDRSFIRYVARVGGVPAGAATATFTPLGVMLHSGSTLPALRGRGVYSSLVAHRWQEAVARGTPRVVTRAGPMSRPILRKLGFQEIGEIHFFVDRFT